jgi:hypothetical protein
MIQSRNRVLKQIIEKSKYRVKTTHSHTCNPVEEEQTCHMSEAQTKETPHLYADRDLPAQIRHYPFPLSMCLALPTLSAIKH